MCSNLLSMSIWVCWCVSAWEVLVFIVFWCISTLIYIIVFWALWSEFFHEKLILWEFECYIYKNLASESKRLRTNLNFGKFIQVKLSWEIFWAINSWLLPVQILNWCGDSLAKFNFYKHVSSLYLVSNCRALRENKSWSRKISASDRLKEGLETCHGLNDVPPPQFCLVLGCF